MDRQVGQGQAEDAETASLQFKLSPAGTWITLSLMILLYGCAVEWPFRHLARMGVACPAQVIEAVTKDERNSVKLQFEDRANRLHRVTIDNAATALFDEARNYRWLKIKYDPDDPQRIVFVDFPYSARVYYGIAALLALIGIGLWYRARRATARAAPAAKPVVYTREELRAARYGGIALLVFGIIGGLAYFYARNAAADRADRIHREGVDCEATVQRVSARRHLFQSNEWSAEIEYRVKESGQVHSKTIRVPHSFFPGPESEPA